MVTCLSLIGQFVPTANGASRLIRSIQPLSSSTDPASTRAEHPETNEDEMAESAETAASDELLDNIGEITSFLEQGSLSTEQQQLLTSPSITVSLNRAALTAANRNSTREALRSIREARNRRHASNMISCKDPFAPDITRDVWISDATRYTVCPSVTEIDFKATRQPMVMLRSPCACAYGQRSNEALECTKIEIETAILTETSPGVWVVSIISQNSYTFKTFCCM